MATRRYVRAIDDAPPALSCAGAAGDVGDAGDAGDAVEDEAVAFASTNFGSVPVLSLLASVAPVVPVAPVGADVPLVPVAVSCAGLRHPVTVMR